MMTFRQRLSAACLLTSTAMLFHCSSSSKMGFIEPPPPTPFDALDPESQPSDCPLRCSDDLRDVLDCNGAVREHCAGTLACGGVSCIPACEATAANRSNVGCTHVVPRVVNTQAAGCHALFITNVWSESATVEVSYDGETLDVANKMLNAADFTPIAGGKIPPGTTAVIGLAGYECDRGLVPLKADRNASFRTFGKTETGRTPAFVVTADVPVQIHAIEPFAYDPHVHMRSGALLASTSAWGTDYVVSALVTPFPEQLALATWLQIVGGEDGTIVEIQPRQRLLGGPDLQGAQPDQRRAYPVRRGETLQFRQMADLTGSLIHANKPVGVFTGAPSLIDPTGAAPWDDVQAQLWPVQSLGHVYPAVRYRDRYEGTPETTIWRVVGAVAGTELRYEPSAPAGAPETIDLGESVEFAAGAPFVVASQDAEHPFALFSFMTGADSYGEAGDYRGGPEFVPVVSAVQYLRKYRFPTDPTLPETHVVVVRQRGSAGFAEVVLDCAGTLGGWDAIGPSGEFEYTRIDLTRGNFIPQGNCTGGVHAMGSDLPFTATIWGWGSPASGDGRLLADGGVNGRETRGASYGFPAGAGFRPVNHVSYSGVE